MVRLISVAFDLGHLQLLRRVLNLLLLLLLSRAARLLQLAHLGLTLLHHVHLLLPFIHVREVLTLADWFDLARAQLLVLKINGAPICIIL